jgi:hypothetical protein
VEGLAIQPEGKIVTADSVNGSTNSDQFTIARYLSDGTLDKTFGREGMTRPVATEKQPCR